MNIFDKDFVSSTRFDHLMGDALETEVPVPKVSLFRLKTRLKDPEIVAGLEREMKEGYVFTLDEFNALMTEEITLFNRGEDGQMHLFPLQDTFPFFNLYVFDGGDMFVAELFFLFEKDLPSCMLYYNRYNEHTWAEGTYIVAKIEAKSLVVQ